ncbi:M48 family metallopeptidase [Bacteriovoracaceae bacterium]|nr:M48 family metallopeptidase [Bacteriovoracaceae bacterium]
MKSFIVFIILLASICTSFAQGDLLSGQPEQEEFQKEIKRILRNLIGDGADEFNIILTSSQDPNSYIAEIKNPLKTEIDILQNPNPILEFEKGRKPTLYLNTRIFSMIDSEDELAGIIAHEIAHTAQYKEETITLFKRLFGTIWMELDADLRALLILSKANPPYNPNALINFFRKLIAKHGQNKLSLFMSHPMSVVRISAMNNWMSKNMYKLHHIINGQKIDGFFNGKTNLNSFLSSLENIEGVIKTRLIKSTPRTGSMFSVNWKSVFGLNKSEAQGMDDQKKVEKLLVDTDLMFKTLFQIEGFNQLPDADKIDYIDNLVHLIDPDGYFINEKHRYNIYEWLRKCVEDKCDQEKMKELDPRNWNYSTSYFDEDKIIVSGYMGNAKDTQTKIMFEYLTDVLGYKNNEAVKFIEANGFIISTRWEWDYWRDKIKTSNLSYKTFNEELQHFSNGKYLDKYGNSPTLMGRNLSYYIERKGSQLSVVDYSNILNSKNSYMLLRLLKLDDQRRLEAKLTHYITVKMLEGTCKEDRVCYRFFAAAQIAETDGNTNGARKLSWFYRNLHDYAMKDRRSLNLLNGEEDRILSQEHRMIIKRKILETKNSNKLVHKIYMAQYMFTMPNDLLSEILSELDNDTLKYFYSYKDFDEGMKLVNPSFNVSYQNKEFIMSKIIPNISGTLASKRNSFAELVGLLEFYNESIDYTIDAERKKTFEEYFPESEGKFGPAYYKNLEKTEVFQKEIVDRLNELKAMPTDPEAFTDFFIKLTKNGVTPLTDNLISEALKEGMQLTEKQMDRIFSGQRVWDFSVRQKLFEKVSMQSSFEELKVGSKAERASNQIRYIERKIKLFYPEPSIDRNRILDQFLWKVNAGDEVIASASKYFSSEYEFKNAKVGLAYLYNRIYGLLVEEGRALNEEKRVLLGSAKDFPDQTPKVMHQFVMYMLGDPNYSAPENVKAEIIDPIGENRYKRLFESLSYEVQAGLLSTFFEKPTGILASKKYSDQIINHSVRKLGANRQSAIEIINAFSEAFSEKQPFRQTLFLSYILTNSSNTANLSEGKQIKLILESIGPIGVSLGQKLYQFNIFDDPEINKELATLTHNAGEVSKVQVNQLLKEKLKITGNIDDILEYDLMGDASSKIVLKLKYKDGKFPDELLELSKSESEIIFKFLLEDYKSKANQDSELLVKVMNLLMGKNGKKYAPLKVAADAVIDGMLSQKDVDAEIKNKDTFEKIYSGEDDHYRFETVKSRSVDGMDGVFEEVAEGKVLVLCNCPDEIEQIRNSIYDKDEFNLVDNENDRIDFDYDRHDGNFIVQPKVGDEKGTITIIDHALSSHISRTEREQLFLAIGQLEVYREVKNPLARRDFVQTIHQLAHSGNESKGKSPTIKEISRKLKEIDLAKTTNFKDLLTVLVTIPETESIKRVNKYVTALSHLKSHGAHKEKINGMHPLDYKIEVKVKKSLLKYQDNMNFLTRLVLKCLE